MNTASTTSLSPHAGFQPTLLAQGPLVLESSFPSAQRVRLDQSSWVELVPGWVLGADDLFDELLDRTRWEGHRRLMFDRWVDEPRLHGAVPKLSDAMDSLMTQLGDSLAERYERTFDSGWAALYRNGRDSVAWHGDSIGHHRSDSVVAVLSLGATRRFSVREKPGLAPDSPVTINPPARPVQPARTSGRRRSYSWTLGSGDLVVMGGACQRDWQHAVPKMAHAGPRISLQFRSPGWDGRSRSARLASR